jgi:hypothetical protein
VTDLPSYVYVASSWRCLMQDAVCAVLKAASIPHYDFKNPEGASTGFSWAEVMPDFHQNTPLDRQTYLDALEHPRAIEGFGLDMAAMNKADTFVLVLPCNRSAHLELGWAIGQGKRTAVLLSEDPVVPELMYKMVDYLAPSVFDLLGWLGVKDER